MTEVTAARKRQQNRSSLCSDGFTALHGKNAFVHFSVLLRLLVTSNLLKPRLQSVDELHNFTFQH